MSAPRDRALVTRRRPRWWRGDPDPPFEVRVMTRAEGYAMVRRARDTPFVVPERELQPVTAGQERER